jgi:hypothetical protein
MPSAFQDQLGFGAGVLIGQAVGTATPIRFGVLQDCNLDFAPKLESLYGQNRYAVALAAGSTKTTVKAKYAGFRGRALFDLYFAGASSGTSLTTGTRAQFVDSELHSGVAGSFTAANVGAGFLGDQGVYIVWSGKPLVGFDPAIIGATGDYTVDAAGNYSLVYAPTAADLNPVTGGFDLYVSYTFTDSTQGTRITFGNPRMGTNPVFSARVNMAYDGRSALWTFPRCVASKMSFPTKLDGFQMNDFEFELAADIAGNLGTLDTDL